MKNYILGAIVMILSIWFLPKLIGIQSLIWGFGLCFIITSLLNIKMIKKIINAKRLQIRRGNCFRQREKFRIICYIKTLRKSNLKTDILV
jgi:hypothetical protein